MSRDRKLKLVYDVKSTPSGISITDIVKIMESHDVVLWDSDKEAARPRFYGLDKEGQEEDLVLVDVKGKTIDLEVFTKEYAEKEKWDKELHRCKNSPVYYFTNYGTTVYPHTQKDLRAYLETLGLEDLSGIKDSDKAAEMWKEQKAKMATAMSFVTEEHLKERAGVVEAMRVAYEEQMGKLIEEVSDSVKLHDKEGNLLPEDKQIQNLIGRIKQMPIPADYGSYRNRKNKWDHGMLLATDYAALLNMYYNVSKVEV